MCETPANLDARMTQGVGRVCASCHPVILSRPVRFAGSAGFRATVSRVPKGDSGPRLTRAETGETGETALRTVPTVRGKAPVSARLVRMSVERVERVERETGFPEGSPLTLFVSSSLRKK